MAAKVSIIIPCYNQGHYIKDALQSIDRNLCEVIIVNDGSTDTNTIEVLAWLEKEGYRIINQKNMGLGAARNNGIKVAAGKYILPLDSDNKIKAGYIAEAVEILDKDEKINVVYADAQYFGDKQGIFESAEFNLQRLMIENYIDACAIYRKSVWERVGGYDEKMPVMGYEDWDFWLHVAFYAGGGFKYIHKPLFDYRYSNASMIRTVRAEDYAKVLNYVGKKYEQYLGREYLNNLIFYKASKKGLAVYIILRSGFPRLYNLLRKMGMVKSKDVI